MTKHTRWLQRMKRNGHVPKPGTYEPGNPGVVKGILTHNHTPQLPSDKRWALSVPAAYRKPGRVT